MTVMLRVLMAVVVMLAVGTPSSFAQDEGPGAFAQGLAAFDAGDYRAAVAQWRPLAEAGHAEAQLALADLYRNGLGVPVDLEAAVGWYRKAAEQGNATAQLNLGDFYSEGIGVPRDLVQAYVWLSLAARQGSRWAQGRRDTLAREMTAAQLADARRKVAQWHRAK